MDKFIRNNGKYSICGYCKIYRHSYQPLKDILRSVLMIDEVLRQKMGQALEEGRFDEALKLSVLLDEQILKAVKSQFSAKLNIHLL